MSIMVVTIQWLIPPEDVMARVIRMIVAILGGGMIYGVVIFFHSGQVSREVREVAGWILGMREPLEMKHLYSFCHRVVAKK